VKNSHPPAALTIQKHSPWIKHTHHHFDNHSARKTSFQRPGISKHPMEEANSITYASDDFAGLKDGQNISF
jgi:hypothetical protein